MEFIIRIDFGLVSGVFFALVCFGIGYNALVAQAERRGWLEGFTSLAVVVGTLVTLVGAAVVSLPAALLVLCCFAASGLPMVAGSILRYIRDRELARRALIEEARSHADHTQGMA